MYTVICNIFVCYNIEVSLKQGHEPLRLIEAGGVNAFNVRRH